MKKYIHYCWFGNNPLPKLAKKCIKSWKKYLPDYEIIQWNENNVDVNECPFVKEAYENKKWAFVADYARTKAIYEMGGIYFDTDMMIKKDISFLLDNETFVGIEDSMMVNSAVWGTSKPKTELARRMLEFYQSQEHFNIDDIYKMSIPRIMTRILDEYGFDSSIQDVQILNKNIYVYPREYFYPLSYDYRNNIFTDNTCMVHYFDATWIPKRDQIEIKLIRKFGETPTRYIFGGYRFAKRNAKRAIKLLFYPIVLLRRYRNRYNKKYITNIKNAVSDIRNVKDDYIIIHNPEWLGVTSATIELFDSRVRCGELLRKKDIKLITKEIINSKVKQVIFSAMALGWLDVAKELKRINPEIKIKVFWHGSHSQVSEPYGWTRNLEIITLHKEGIIDVFATCKESILDFYENENYKTHFIRNNVILPNKIKGNRPKDVVRVGLYAAKCDDWRKNLFAQMAAVSLIPNAVIDMVPLSPEAKNFAASLGVKIEGLDKAIPRNELLERMANNSINLYVTFSECAPMLPIESFEVGVPCLLGNNNHYFIDTELEDYLVVNNEEDAEEIVNKIKYCLENESKVMKLYSSWKKENDKLSKKSVEDFLKM